MIICVTWFFTFYIWGFWSRKIYTQAAGFKTEKNKLYIKKWYSKSKTFEGLNLYIYDNEGFCRSEFVFSPPSRLVTILKLIKKYESNVKSLIEYLFFSRIRSWRCIQSGILIGIPIMGRCLTCMCRLQQEWVVYSARRICASTPYVIKSHFISRSNTRLKEYLKTLIYHPASKSFSWLVVYVEGEIISEFEQTE